MTQSICGSFLVDKRSLVAFTWTITTVLTYVALIVSLAVIIHTHTRFKRQEHFYEQQWDYYHDRRYLEEGGGDNHNNNNNNNNDHNDAEDEHRSGDNNNNNNNNKNGNMNNEELQQYLLLAAMSSKSMPFVVFFVTITAMGLTMYGSTAIVGFTSLRGVYIAPCFSSSSSSKLQLGIFGGGVVFFANVLLVCAVVLGEVWVQDWKEQRDEREPYEVERIATILAVTYMFLAALYSIFAVLLFLFFGNEDDDGIDEHHHHHRHHHDRGGVVSVAQPLPSITTDPRRENFITMGPEQFQEQQEYSAG